MFVNSAVIEMFLVKAEYKTASTIPVLFSSSENKT
jgi:hypothetical protein